MKRNYEVYLSRMNAAMAEKLFFLDKIDLSRYDTIIDFGCADGTLINHLIASGVNPKKLIGIDSSLVMAATFKNNCPGVEIYSSLEYINDSPSFKRGKVAIIFSSVLHELSLSFYPVWSWVSRNADAVIIRDMFLFNDFKPHAFFRIVNDIQNSPYGYEFRDYIKTNPAEVNSEYLLQFLMKYRYIENWELEKLEDYASVPWKEIEEDEEFQITYDHSYFNEYIERTLKRDFNITEDDYHYLQTHRQMILERV